MIYWILWIVRHVTSSNEERFELQVLEAERLKLWLRKAGKYARGWAAWLFSLFSLGGFGVLFEREKKKCLASETGGGRLEILEAARGC